ncbi:Transmembrane protein, partial [Phytophthora palmivora]
LVKCNECCKAQQSNARVAVAKAQAELERTETQLKKLRTAIGNQFDRRISEAMALELNGPSANDLIVKSRQSVRRVSRRPSNALKAEATVKEDKRRITVTLKKETQAVLRANRDQVAEKRKTIKKAKRAAATEQRKLKREAKREQKKLLEGLRGIDRLKKRLHLYLEAREERKIAALPLHERQAYLTEKEQLKKIRRTSRLLYNAFLRRQPAHQAKPLFPEWVVYLSYTISAVWSGWCIYFVLMFAFTTGHVEAQLWVTSFLAGLALTYLISDPIKVFLRMGLMPIIAAGILANSGFFSAVGSEPMALGVAAVAAGAGYVAKHQADRRARRKQRRLRKANSNKLVPVTTVAEENNNVEADAVQTVDDVVEVVAMAGRVDANDSDNDSDGEMEQRKNSFTDLTRLGLAVGCLCRLVGAMHMNEVTVDLPCVFVTLMNPSSDLGQQRIKALLYLADYLAVLQACGYQDEKNTSSLTARSDLYRVHAVVSRSLLERWMHTGVDVDSDVNLN